MIESRHPSQEQAIAAALEASEPGDEVEIHASDCALSAYSGEEYTVLCPDCGGLPCDPGPTCVTCGRGMCGCEPIVIKVGPEA